jgi:hypothetical protein
MGHKYNQVPSVDPANSIYTQSKYDEIMLEIKLNIRKIKKYVVRKCCACFAMHHKHHKR